MARISHVIARQILDSRGVPTVEVTVELDNGTSATSSVPSGNVSNKYEAVELRDQRAGEYFGMGVTKAVENVNSVIQDRLIGMDALYQTQIDQMLVNLDGTTNKSKLGSNAILATSQAVMKAAAASLKLPLFVYIKEKYQIISTYRIPTPIFNLINGGSHGSGTLEFQEFQLVPASHLAYGKALQIGVETFMALDKILEQKGAIRAVGMEGGYSPNLAENTDALEIFAEAMKLTPYALAKDAFLGIDVAPKTFFKGGKYTIKDRNQPMTAKEMVKFYQELHHQYRVFSFEDPLMPDAWEDWKFMTAEMGDTAMIVADDLVTTNKTLLMKAVQEKACNTLVIKPNRVGTVTEAIEITQIARQAGWHTILSHRSGETTDDFIADLAVGIGTEYVKFGAPSRGERVVKYNRLLRIEEILSRSNKQQTQTTPSGGSMNPTAPAPATPTPPLSATPTTPSAPPAAMTAPVATTTPAPAPVSAPSPSVPPMMAAYQNAAPTTPAASSNGNPGMPPATAMQGNGLQSILGNTSAPAPATPAPAPATQAPTLAPSVPPASAPAGEPAKPVNPAWSFPAPTSDELVATPVPGMHSTSPGPSVTPSTPQPMPTAPVSPTPTAAPAPAPSLGLSIPETPSAAPAPQPSVPTPAPASAPVPEIAVPATDAELQKSIDQLAEMVTPGTEVPASPTPAPMTPPAESSNPDMSTAVASNTATPSFPAGLRPPTPPQI